MKSKHLSPHSKAYRENLKRQLLQLRSQESWNEIAETLSTKSRGTREYQIAQMNYEEKLERVTHMLSKAWYNINWSESRIEPKDDKLDMDIVLDMCHSIWSKYESGEALDSREINILTATMMLYVQIINSEYWSISDKVEISRWLISKFYKILPQESQEKISTLMAKGMRHEMVYFSNYSESIRARNKDLEYFRHRNRNFYDERKDKHALFEIYDTSNIFYTLSNSMNFDYIADVICLLAYNREYIKLPESTISMLWNKNLIEKIINDQRLRDNNVSIELLFMYFEKQWVTLTAHEIIKAKDLKKSLKIDRWFRTYKKEWTWDHDDLDKSMQVRDKNEKNKMISEVFDQDGVKIEQLQQLQKVINSVDIWQWVAQQYKTPSFINKYLEVLESNWMLDSESAKYLIESTDQDTITEKYDHNVIKNIRFSIYDNGGVTSAIEAITKLLKVVNINFEQLYIWDRALLYIASKNEWISLTPALLHWALTSYTEKIANNTRQGTKFNEIFIKYIGELVDDCLNTGNTDIVHYLVSLPTRVKREMHLTASQVDLLTRLAIKKMTNIEDYKTFKNRMLETQKSSLLIYLSVILENKVNISFDEWEAEFMPKSIYKYFLEHGRMDILAKKLENGYIKISDDPVIDNIESVINFSEQDHQEQKDKKAEDERLKKIAKEKQEERVQIETDAIRNVQNWISIIDYRHKDQKFVLSLDQNNKRLMFLSAPLDFHANIHYKYCKDWYCLGWWRMEVNQDNKTIMLYWSSESYGTIDNKFIAPMKEILLRDYPWYKII